MSFFEAYHNLDRELHGILMVYANSESHHFKIKSLDNTQVTIDGFSFKGQGYEYSCKFNDVHSLSVKKSVAAKQFYVNWNPRLFLHWLLEKDARNFADAVMAMKYYSSKKFSTDDDSVFADYQLKAKAWLALPQKPALAEEVRRFRVLGDDAVQNKNFYDAADYYEKGLALDPLWPAGQFNAAMIYGELKYYPLAVMHMKRYLALKPDDAQKYQDKLYIWEEKVNKENDLSDDTNDQPEQSQRGSR